MKGSFGVLAVDLVDQKVIGSGLSWLGWISLMKPDGIMRDMMICQRFLRLLRAVLLGPGERFWSRFWRVMTTPL